MAATRDVRVHTLAFLLLLLPGSGMCRFYSDYIGQSKSLDHINFKGVVKNNPTRPVPNSVS